MCSAFRELKFEQKRLVFDLVVEFHGHFAHHFAVLLLESLHLSSVESVECSNSLHVHLVLVSNLEFMACLQLLDHWIVATVLVCANFVGNGVDFLLAQAQLAVRCAQ